MSVNKVILLGRVGVDPELKSLENDGKVVNFSLATSERFKGKDGSKQEKTEWHNVVAWGTVAEIIAKNVVKGQELFVEGKIQTRSWNDKEGNKKYTTEIVANNITFVGSKKTTDSPAEGASATSTQNTSSNKGAGKNNQPAVVTTTSEDDDLPF